MSLKQIQIIGCFCFIASFIFSLLFYKERTVFTDIAFHIFQITKDGSFAIQNNRFGAVFTQLIPLLAVKIGASLNTVMLLYSLSFIIYYFIIFCICVFLLKQSRHGLLLILFLVLFTSHTFYWIQSELPQGLAFIILIFAIYTRYEDEISANAIWRICFAVLIMFLAFFHPLLIVPLFFILTYLWLKRTQRSVMIYYVLLLSLFLFTTFVKSVIFPTSGYEASALSGLGNFIRLFPDYLNLYSNKNFLENCIRLYYFIPLVFLLNCIYYLKNKFLREFLLLSILFVGYLMLVNISYFEVKMDFYIENLYLPLTIIILVPFIFEVLPSYPEVYRTTIIFIIIAVGFIRIYSTGNIYSSRLTWQQNLLDKNPDKKMFIDSKVVPMDTLITAWGTPYEFWLLSTAETGNSASVFVVQDSIQNFFNYLPENNTAFFTFEKYEYAELNDGKYFNFNDTSRYKIITAD